MVVNSAEKVARTAQRTSYTSGLAMYVCNAAIVSVSGQLLRGDTLSGHNLCHVKLAIGCCSIHKGVPCNISER